MNTDSFSQQKAQLDKTERKHLEAVVEKLRSRVEDNVRFQLTQKGLGDEPEDRDSLDDDREKLVEAINIERADNHSWKEAFDEYTASVGYTIVNRLAALRCMEVRGFIDEEVTVFKQNGLTPAAETLVREDFLLEDEAIITAYHNACDELADEIEILFNRSSAYGLIDPNDDTFNEVCGILDEIPDEVWRADDVLGWVYEYYNRPVVEALDAKNKLDPEDIGPANQFYTPHWVVRMLTDNSLGKLYLEASNQQDNIPSPDEFSPEERKDRQVTPANASTVPELCTYLIPDEEFGDAPEFDHPRELRVIDPACGSGHFLLYAFDILERIWWTETDVDHTDIPAKILKYNIYGIDIDLRSCQLSVFNLYLKARTRAEVEGGQFEMPSVGIVCADARVAEIEEGAEVLDEITGKGTDLREAIDDVIQTFQHTEGLGSLLDVNGTLAEAFDPGQTQTELGAYTDGTHQSLNSFLKALRRAAEDQTTESFGEQNLRSFLNLLVVLTQDYDTTLMNPPYGASGRMPKDVSNYVKKNYSYTSEYYVNFFEACNRLSKEFGRIGMIVQRSFMFKSSFTDFREDLIGKIGTFDFLAEYGNDVLDKATVRTAGSIIRSGASTSDNATGIFYRLHDLDASEKELGFLNAAFISRPQYDIQREYRRRLSEFNLIPETPLSYWVPEELRRLYSAETVFDAENGRVDRKSAGDVKVGLQTGNDQRFTRKFWESDSDFWVPFAKGGEDAWILPSVDLVLGWGSSGEEIKRYSSSRPQNTQYYFSEALTYTYMKSSGRRFGYLHPSSIFGHAGNVFLPRNHSSNALTYANSHLMTYLMLCQTPERHWEVGNVSKTPWNEELESRTELKDLSQEVLGYLISKRQYNFTSPYYTTPVLLDIIGIGDSLIKYQDHPHRELASDLSLEIVSENGSKEESLSQIGVSAHKHLERIEAELRQYRNSMDSAVFDCFDITPNQQEAIFDEISLRTNENPREQKEYDIESITEPSGDFPEQVKDLLLHFALRSVHESDDGIIPVCDIDDKEDILAHIKTEFERVWGEHADMRLAEVDKILGSRMAGEEAYPNLRMWLEEDLFDYHVSKFDRTPIIWRFTSKRLVSDANGEGFRCLVDYHQIYDGIFDRLQSRYLEPRKKLLRERRNAANQRRSDSSLSTSEQTGAAEEYARCESGLEQIAVFEDRLAELAQSESRQMLADEQQVAQVASDRVANFCHRTEERLEIVDELAAMENVDMSELFTGNFHEKVKNQREEWINALEDLETAFDAYATDSDQPVEAHLYDMFEYYTDDLLGSSHFASNGILYMTYYFDKFEQVNQSQLDNGGASRRQRLISQLASDLEEYIELGESISEDCKRVSSEISSDWADRALSEITTAGYRPNHKHGVEINITPLARAEIVPKTVEDDVL